jgi:hypothetical protein
MKILAQAMIVGLCFATTLTSGTPKSDDIRRIDFKNFSFPWDEGIGDSVPSDWHWISPLPQSRIRVVDGIHHFYSPGQDKYKHEHAPLIRLHSVTHGDLDGDGNEEAAVHLNYSSGGTANWDFLYVYTLSRGRPTLLGILESGSRADGGLVRVVIEKQYLVLDFADGERRVGDCCSEGYIRVHYRWRKGGFVEEGPREKGDLPLNER